jgi:hypothetical protein
MTSVLTSVDRRAKGRFAVETPLRYRAANSPLNAAWKHGCTLNMSAGGVLIRIPESPAVGEKLELAMDWNGLYHGREKMRLFLVAAVTRSDRRGTALRILANRFRDMSLTRVRLRRAEKKLAVA